MVGLVIGYQAAIQQHRFFPVHDGPPGWEPPRAQASSTQEVAANVPRTARGAITVTGRHFVGPATLRVRVSLDEEIFAETMVPVRADGVLSATLIPDLEWREGTYLVNVSLPDGVLENPPGYAYSLLIISGPLAPEAPPHDPSAVVTTTAPESPTGPITVSGTGFAPHADLRVTVQEDQSSDLPVDTRIAADATGSFTLSATPPVFWQRDKGHVVVISQGPEQQVRATFKTPHFT